MSWLARSIANSLRIEDDENQSPSHNRRQVNSPENDVEQRENEDRRGVKDDLTEFRETLTRQIWGVANFLAPPPPSDSHDNNNQDHRVMSELNRRESRDVSVSGDENDHDHDNDNDNDNDNDDDDDSSVYARISTAQSDHLEIGGGGGLFHSINQRILDNNSGVSRNYESCGSFNRLGLQNVGVYEDFNEDNEGENLNEDEDEDENEDWINEAVGLTDEVLAFAGNIGDHPETWLDYPIEEDEDFDDFPMSESQKRHVQAIEHLSPRLAALRIELCPAHMSVGFFWKVYFVLLHSRLNKQDAELLSTPEVAEARAKWMQELHKRDKKDSEQYLGHYSKHSADLDEDFTPRSFHNEHSETFSSWTFASDPATSTTTAEADSDTEKQVVNTEMKFTDKYIIDEKPLADTNDKNLVPGSISKRLVLNFDEDDDDDWPEDDCLGQNATVIPVGIEDEVSFSDLEDDDCCIPVKSKPELRV